MTGRRGTLNDTGPPTNLSHDPLERVVGAYLLPVDVREGVVGERFGHAPLDEIGRRVHPGESTIARAFRTAAARLSWAWIALSIWLTSRTLVARSSLTPCLPYAVLPRPPGASGRYSAALSVG